MFLRKALTTATATVVFLVSGVFTAQLAFAMSCDAPLNGTFTATSDGNWAKTREVFKDEATVVANWQVTSACDNVERCRGEVISDQGWRAELKCNSGLWIVVHRVENWQPCGDGRTTYGDQEHKFYRTSSSPESFTGWDRTVGPSGGCGVNQWLVIVLPLTVIKTTD